LPGEYIFTVPEGVTRLHVELWGAGGGGGGGSVAFEGGGGNGGAYVRAIVAVYPGEKYRVMVGAGGAGNPWGNGAKGGDTYLDTQAAGSYFDDPSTLLFARGGAGGYQSLSFYSCPDPGDDAWNNSSRVKYFMGRIGHVCSGRSGGSAILGTVEPAGLATSRPGVVRWSWGGGYGGVDPVLDPPLGGGPGWAFITW
jgi:hypothetical protein